MEWPAYPVKLMGLAIWHVRHLLFDFASYFVDNSTWFTTFRTLVNYYPVQGVLAGTLRNLLKKQDEEQQIISTPPREQDDWQDSWDSMDELLQDYIRSSTPTPFTIQLGPTTPPTPPTPPSPTRRGLPLGRGLGVSRTGNITL